MIRLSFVSFVSFAFVVACVPPAQQQAPVEGAASSDGDQVSSPTTGTEHDDACRAACNVFDQCGKQSFDKCVPECDGMPTHKLERFAMFNCDQLTAVLTGTVGTQCMSSGKDDCAPLGPQYTCCRGNEATHTPGECLDVAVCNMPRY